MNIKTTNQGWAYWTAIDDDTYDGPGSPVGFGRTESAAVTDLVEQITERLEERIDMLRLENQCIRAENQALLTRCLQNLPETSCEDDRGALQIAEEHQDQALQSETLPRGAQEEDCEETRCQGRLDDDPDYSGYDDKRHDDAEWS